LTQKKKTQSANTRKERFETRRKEKDQTVIKNTVHVKNNVENELKNTGEKVKGGVAFFASLLLLLILSFTVCC